MVVTGGVIAAVAVAGYLGSASERAAAIANIAVTLVATIIMCASGWRFANRLKQSRDSARPEGMR